MISLQMPHMALNAFDTVQTVRMSRTHRVSQSTSVDQMIQWICNYAHQGDGIIIKNLVLNCHGTPGHLYLGQGIGQADLHAFRGIGSLVEKIWLRACYVAGRNSRNERVGNTFCSTLAREAQCYVVAPTELNVSVSGTSFPYGQIGTYEGLVLTWGHNGQVTSSRRFPSAYQRVPGDDTSWHRNSD